MPSVRDEKTKKATNAMATVATAADEPDDQGEDRPSRGPAPAPSSAARPGFFTIYKKGKGKWTRLGTVFGAVFIAGLTVYNLCFVYLPPYVHNRQVIWGAGAGFLLVFGLFVFWLMNKPSNADFLIDTDSEMKKVNWTTQGELIGSTRVVILFVIFIAVFLFVVDIIFAEFFHLITVLRAGPFQ